MIYRELGSSGIEVSAVGFGAWAIGGWMWGGRRRREVDRRHPRRPRPGHQPHRHRPRLRLRPLRGNRRPGHRRTPRQGRPGHQVRLDLGPRGRDLLLPRRRKRRHLAARRPRKSSAAFAPTPIRAELERSLARLGTDHVDLYQTHWQDTSHAHRGHHGRPAEAEGAREDPRDRRLATRRVEEMKVYGPIDSDQEKYSLLDRQDRDQRHGRALPRARHRHSGLFAAGQRAVDRQDPSRPPIRPRRFAEGQSRFLPRNVERVNAMLREARSRWPRGIGRASANW